MSTFDLDRSFLSRNIGALHFICDVLQAEKKRAGIDPYTFSEYDGAYALAINWYLSWLDEYEGKSNE